MAAKDEFETIRLNVLELGRLEEHIAELKAACGPRAMATEPSGHGGRRELLSPEDALAEAEERRDVMSKRLESTLSRACDVLYGKSGRGGIAKYRGSGAADSIHGYYLQGMTWEQVSDELVKPESRDGPQWCKRTAYRALEYADKVGLGVLADS